VQRILEFSPSYALSKAINIAGVDELRTSALRFDRAMAVMNCGREPRLVPRRIAMPKEHLIRGMILIPGTSYFAFVDRHSAVHLADIRTGGIVDTWRYPHKIEAMDNPQISLWHSWTHGLVLIIIMRVEW
jgi:hypothetical protein